MNTLLFEQILNGVQFGMFLFLVSAGLTLVFGFMNVINLAHGSLYMIGAFATAYLTGLTGSFLLGLILAGPVVAAFGFAVEFLIIRTLYNRNHLDQVLATFGLILFFNEAVVMVFGRSPLFIQVPEFLSGTVHLFGDLNYSVFRMAIILVGLGVALLLWFVMTRTRIGMVIRAGTTHHEMVEALGVNIAALNALIFVGGGLLAGLAGAMAGPLMSVEEGMGENLLILCFVCIVIGGVGSVKGALFGAILVGLVDTMSRSMLPDLLRLFMEPAAASGVGAGLSSMMIYILMAGVLIFRPTGMFPAVAKA